MKLTTKIMTNQNCQALLMLQKEHGDCDTDNDCLGPLICGRDNCKRYNPFSAEDHDCCEKRNKPISFCHENCL